MTRQRTAILEVLRADKCHHTADEIFELAKRKLPTISRATVYNSLHYLEDAGFIRRLSGEGASARYDGSYMPHGHLFCTGCGGIFDFTIPDFNRNIEKAAGCSVESYELKILGKCEACKALK